MQPLRLLVVFMAGHQPADETAYLHHLLPALGISMAELEGAEVAFEHVELTQLDLMYVNGWTLASGYPVEQCTITPFTDRDGGQGFVLRVYAAETSAFRAAIHDRAGQASWPRDASRAQVRASRPRSFFQRRRTLALVIIALSMLPLLVLAGAIALLSRSVMAGLVFLLLFGAWIVLLGLAFQFKGKASPDP